MFCPEKECLLFDYEDRSHQGSRSKMRRIVKCPNCFQRIFTPGQTSTDRNHTLQQFFEHTCPGQADEIAWTWLPEQNRQTSERAAKKEAAQARRAKFAALQADRKRQATELNVHHMREANKKRNYHSHFDIQRMNQESPQPTASASSNEAQTVFHSRNEGVPTIQSIQTMTNPLAQTSPPNEPTKRAAASIPELTIPGSAEKKAAQSNKQKGGKVGKGGTATSSGISEELAATAISPAPPPHRK